MRLTRTKGNQFGQRWSVLHTFLIPNPAGDRTYLKRLRLIQTPYFGIYLHWIYLRDADRDPHDHPWNFWSFIVRGGYTERVWRVSPVSWPCDETTHPPRDIRRSRFSLHRHPMTIAHMITQLDPGTITLVLVGRRQRHWGFWTAGGFVEWQDYERSGTPVGAS